MQVGVPGVGGVTLSADIKAEGKLNSTIATHVVTGISYSKSTGFRTIKSFKENGGSNTSTEASASMGASLKCGITDLKVITGYVYAKAGVKAQIVIQCGKVDSLEIVEHFWPICMHLMERKQVVNLWRKSIKKRKIYIH